MKFTIFDDPEDSAFDRDVLLRRGLLESVECAGMIKVIFKEVNVKAAASKTWAYALLLNMLTIAEMIYFARAVSETARQSHI